MYLNNAYFGNGGVWGVEDASEKYWCTGSQLTLDQCHSSRINMTKLYNPLNLRLTNRRDTVLQNMAAVGHIDKNQEIRSGWSRYDFLNCKI